MAFGKKVVKDENEEVEEAPINKIGSKFKAKTKKNENRDWVYLVSLSESQKSGTLYKKLKQEDVDKLEEAGFLGFQEKDLFIISKSQKGDFYNFSVGRLQE